MDEVNLRDIGIMMGARKKFEEVAEKAGKGVGVEEILPGKGQAIEAPPVNKLIEALLHRVEQYETEGKWNRIEFDGTKTIIEKKLANPYGLTASDIEVLEQLQQRINSL